MPATFRHDECFEIAANDMQIRQSGVIANGTLQTRERRSLVELLPLAVAMLLAMLMPSD
jgi:hypothetical protein